MISFINVVVATANANEERRKSVPKTIGQGLKKSADPALQGFQAWESLGKLVGI